jgi:hypothetical protein
MLGRLKTSVSLALCLLVFYPLWHVDRWLSEGHRPRLGYMRLLDERLQKKPNADVAIMGQSTIAKWLLDGDRFARMYKLPKSEVVGAQIGGCDYTCSFAEARRLLAAGEHWKQIYYGANLYQMCEDPWSWRVFTPLALIPWRDFPDLLLLWGHAQRPLSYYGRVIGMGVSNAYDDSIAARERLADTLGLPRPKKSRFQPSWARPIRNPKNWSPACNYEPDEIALKTAAVQRLLPDLTRLADQVYYLVLPDRSSGERKYRAAFQRFVEHQRALVHAVPGVVFVDLVTDGAWERGDYIDGAHLSAQGISKQSALLKQRLDELGVKVAQ